MRRYKQIFILVMSLILSGLIGCDDSDGEGNDDFECRGGACDSGSNSSTFNHRWAIDVQKVQAQNKYAGSQRFIAAVPTDLLPAPLASAACEREIIVNEDGSTEEGGCFLWGNMMRLNHNHSRHIDNPEEAPIVNIIDSGRMIDPPGYLNIIAQLNAARDEQTEIRNSLRNGDILVYFHPEDNNTTQFRMHHAAMYYDTGEGPLAISLDGVPFVHHIDNPVSYGPAFNSGPTTPPYHVYRFNPNGAPDVAGRDESGYYQFLCTDELRDNGGPNECQAGADTFTISDDMAAQYSYIARNWALMTNGHAPFANFHNMSWNDADGRAAQGYGVLDEVDRYARPALERGRTPEVYCAGLVFTNLNLALNRPLNERGLGSDLAAIFASANIEFDDRFMRLGASDWSVRPALTASELEDTMDLPRLGRLVFEPIPASDIVDAWLEGYFGPLPRQARAQVLAGASGQISQGFRSLEWAAGKLEDFAGSVVATPQRIQSYAMAYSSGDADDLTITAQGGELVVVPGSDGEPDLPQMKELERRYVENRYVPPPLYHVMANRPDSLISYVGTVIHVDLLSPIGENTGDTTTGTVEEFSEGGPDTSLYENFYVPDGGRKVQRVLEASSGPAQVGHGSSISTRISAADIRDIRIVLHPAGSFPPFESLMACNDNADCIGNAPGIVLPLDPSQNGGETVWDDVNVSWDLFAPVEEGGAGCMMVGEVAGDWETVIFTNGEVEAVLDMANNATALELEDQAGVDATAVENIVDARPFESMDAIAALPAVNSAALEALREYVTDWTGSDESRRYAVCPAYNWVTGEVDENERYRLDHAYGQWTITMLDRGEMSQGAVVDNCAHCVTGGGHSNQWFIVVRDSIGEVVIDEPDIDEGCDSESYDSREEAAQSESALAPGDGVDENICEGDQDWFLVHVANDDEVTVTISFDNHQGDLELESVRLDGTRIDSSTSTSNTETVKGSGTFLVRVYGYSNASATYSLVVNEPEPVIIPADCDSSSFDTREAAVESAPLILGASVEENICEGDIDWYLVQAPEEETVSVSITFNGSEGDLDMEAATPDGTSLDRSTSTGSVETVEGTGTFLVRVYGYRNAAASYYLTVGGE